MSQPEVHEGLEGVIAFATEIAEPDKEGSALRYRGVDIEERAVQERDEMGGRSGADGMVEGLLEAGVKLLFVEFGAFKARLIDALVGLDQLLVGVVPARIGRRRGAEDRMEIDLVAGEVSLALCECSSRMGQCHQGQKHAGYGPQTNPCGAAARCGCKTAINSQCQLHSPAD